MIALLAGIGFPIQAVLDKAVTGREPPRSRGISTSAF